MGRLYYAQAGGTLLAHLDESGETADLDAAEYEEGLRSSGIRFRKVSVPEATDTWPLDGSKVYRSVPDPASPGTYIGQVVNR